MLLSSLPRLQAVFALAIFSALTGCGKKDAAPVAAPPPSVSVYTVTTRPVGSFREFVARTEASQSAELRARVQGELAAQHFADGAQVHEDQLLFEIEDRPFQAAMRAAEAEVEKATAELTRANSDLERGRQLAPQGYLSKQDLDRLEATATQAKAALAQAESNLEDARVNLDYTRITAPFSGVIGKARFNVGNVVGPASGSLATVSASDPIYVNFELNEADYTAYLQRQQAAGLSPSEAGVDVRLRLPDNSLYDEPGELNFADTRVDPSTGTVNIRAEFANPQGIILPGSFVTLLAESHNKVNTAVIPQAAVQSTQDGYSVLLVNEHNKVVQRLIQPGRRLNAMWAIEGGLKAGERVIIDGLQKVRAGIEVNPAERSVDPKTGAISSSTPPEVSTPATDGGD